VVRGQRRGCVVTEVSDEGVDVDFASEPVGAVLQNVEAVSSVGKEAVHGHPVTQKFVSAFVELVVPNTVDVKTNEVHCLDGWLIMETEPK
jgi:hypothetical protein